MKFIHSLLEPSHFFFLNLRVLKKLKRNRSNLFIFDRSMTILPSMLNRVFFVHNGRSFSKLRISDPRFFFLKMGSFSFTRKIYYEKRVKNSKKNFK